VPGDGNRLLLAALQQLVKDRRVPVAHDSYHGAAVSNTHIMSGSCSAMVLC
jgi:hypothetical protein